MEKPKLIRRPKLPDEEKRISVKHFLNKRIDANSNGQYAVYVHLNYLKKSMTFKSDTNFYFTEEEFRECNPYDKGQLEAEKKQIIESLKLEKRRNIFEYKGFVKRYKKYHIVLWLLFDYYEQHILYRNFYNLKKGMTEDEIEEFEAAMHLGFTLWQENQTLKNHEWLQKDDPTPLDDLLISVYQRFEEEHISEKYEHFKIFHRMKAFFFILLVSHGRESWKRRVALLSKTEYISITEKEFTVADVMTGQIKTKFKKLEHPTIDLFFKELQNFVDECQKLKLDEGFIRQTVSY